MPELETLQLVWIFFAVITLIKWLIRHDLGRSSLKNVEVPSNNFSVLDIIAALAIFILISGLASVFINEDSSMLRKLSANSICNSLAVAMLLPILNTRYTKGIKAILPPLNKVPANIFTAACYSIPAYGLAAFILTITVYICSLFNYNQIQQHEYLKMFSENSKNILTISAMYISTSIITPILEECLFRGIIQTSLINITRSKWLGIIFGAIIFALMHANPQHFPALLVLGTFFGYVFTKHHSILIAILMHAAFNALNVTGALFNAGS